MSASYQSGVSSSPGDLLQTLVTWLAGQGWTVDSSTTDGTGRRAHLHKGALYVNMRSAGNEKIWPNASGGNWDTDAGYGIGLYLGTGYSGSSGWHAQAGRPLRIDGSTSGCGANLPSGPVSAYHFFDDDSDNITVVVERTPGLYCHLGWGPALAGAGNPESFWYFYGSSTAFRNVQDSTPPSDQPGQTVTAFPPMSTGSKEGGSVECCAFARTDVATWASRWMGNCNNSSSTQGATGRLLGCACNINPDAQGASPSGQLPGYRWLLDRVHQTAFTGALLLPLHLFAENAGSRWAPIGYPPTVFWCEGVGHGYSAAEIYSVGGLDYMLFPHFAVRKAA